MYNKWRSIEGIQYNMSPRLGHQWPRNRTRDCGIETHWVVQKWNLSGFCPCLDFDCAFTKISRFLSKNPELALPDEKNCCFRQMGYGKI
jgi:hypothetical protein